MIVNIVPYLCEENPECEYSTIVSLDMLFVKLKNIESVSPNHFPRLRP